MRTEEPDEVSAFLFVDYLMQTAYSFPSTSTFMTFIINWCCVTVAAPQSLSPEPEPTTNKDDDDEEEKKEVRNASPPAKLNTTTEVYYISIYMAEAEDSQPRKPIVLTILAP